MTKCYGPGDTRTIRGLERHTLKALQFAQNLNVSQADFMEAAVDSLMAVFARNGLLPEKLKRLIQSAEQQGLLAHQRLVEELDGEPERRDTPLDPKVEAAYRHALDAPRGRDTPEMAEFRRVMAERKRHRDILMGRVMAEDDPSNEGGL